MRLSSNRTKNLWRWNKCRTERCQVPGLLWTSCAFKIRSKIARAAALQVESMVAQCATVCFCHFGATFSMKHLMTAVKHFKTNCESSLCHIRSDTHSSSSFFAAMLSARDPKPYRELARLAKTWWEDGKTTHGRPVAGWVVFLPRQVGRWSVGAERGAATCPTSRIPMTRPFILYHHSIVYSSIFGPEHHLSQSITISVPHQPP